MDPSTVAGLGIRWIPQVRAWLSERSESRKVVLDEVNRVLGQDPAELADVYVEPDLQAFNPANQENDEPDEEDQHFRVPAYRWLDSFLVKPRCRDGRHVAFVLSDAGMGKSSILAMLRMSGALEGAWPGINFKLFKLGPDVLEEIETIPHPFETVLLLDSLDEDPDAFGRIEERLIELLKATCQFRQVIITCRTQFFPIQNEYERHGARIKIGGFTCKMVFLALFSELQVESYLKKLYCQDDRQIRLAKKMILSMKSLRMRPMLLAHVEDLIQMSRRGADYEWTPFRTHGALVEAWLDREERKPRSNIKSCDLRAACHVMAIHLQKIQGFLQSGAGGRTISPSNLSALLHQANVSDVIQRVEEFGGRSLLNLNSEGDYRFAHYSIQEFLVVDRMARNPDCMSRYSGSIRYSDELVAFLVSWSNEAPEDWVANFSGANLQKAELGFANFKEACMKNVNLSFANLRGADLRGADLMGANLDNANLRDVKFQGADLSQATIDESIVKSELKGAVFSHVDLSGLSLKGKDLRGCTFFEVDLSGADLAGAHLNDADLSRSDLSRANLFRANLDGAVLAGSTLSSSVLVGTNFSGVDLSGADLRRTDLRQVRGLTPDIVAQASPGDNRTYLPKSIPLPKGWPPPTAEKKTKGGKGKKRVDKESLR